jgi:hypothetical protein
MPWNTVAVADIEAEILPDEVAMLNTIQGSTTILAAVLARVVAELQADILNGGNQIGPAGTLPDQIRGPAIAIVRWEWFLGLPKTDLQSDFRKNAYEAAQKKMDKIRDGSIKTEIPLSPQNVTGAANRMETIRRGSPVDARGWGKLGET